MAHIRQSRPDSGSGSQVKVLKIFQVFLSSVGTLYATWTTGLEWRVYIRQVSNMAQVTSYDTGHEPERGG